MIEAYVARGKSFVVVACIFMQYKTKRKETKINN